MIEKIYSRKRIIFPKIMHRRKVSKVNLFIILIIIALIISIVSFILESYPIFAASCTNAAKSKANNIVHEEVKNMMQNYKYDDLIDVEKDANGNIILIKANTLLINELISGMATNIQKKIDNMPTIMVYINYGSVSGVTILKNFGPKFDIELESAGSVEMRTISEFKSVGVNQTLHRIYLKINTEVNILTPFGTFAKKIDPEVLLTEAVIIGDVPQSYYNLEGLNKENAIEVVE